METTSPFDTLIINCSYKVIRKYFPPHISLPSPLQLWLILCCIIFVILLVLAGVGGELICLTHVCWIRVQKLGIQAFVSFAMKNCLIPHDIPFCIHVMHIGVLTFFSAEDLDFDCKEVVHAYIIIIASLD